jgi:Ca2+-transporting ATPase
LPGGLIEGSGNLRYAQTMAFTTLVFFSLFTVFNVRSDERSAFVGLFSNKWLWGAVLLSLLLQVAVIYVPFLQQSVFNSELGLQRLAYCAAVASSVLWLRELSKMVTRIAVNNTETLRNKEASTCFRYTAHCTPTECSHLQTRSL